MEFCGCAFNALERRKVQLEPDSLLPRLREQLCDGSFGAPLIPRSQIQFRVLLQKHLTDVSTAVSPTGIKVHL